VLNFLRRHWRARDEVPDLLQETYIRVYDAARKEIPKSVRGFVFTTARNLLIDRLRRMNVVMIDTIASFDDLNVIDDVPSPEQQTSARQELSRLQNALNGLPARCRQIVVWRKIQNMPQREIAQRLGVSEGVVEAQVARAMDLLIAAMEDQRGRLVADATRYAAVSARSKK
jgi:RNA polymerase sigma-70 factor (ECF subfamily)